MKNLSLILLISIFAVFILIFYTNTKSDLTSIKLPEIPFIEGNEFCGISTYGKCSRDYDCIKDGCSQQVCRSIYEKEIITTCEWRECYDASQYGLECKCINNACQWA
ncbi:MAG: eight-cysteine-cluster domain-containing protein [Candidatus Aenigmatarchaeota archaeon]